LPSLNPDSSFTFGILLDTMMAMDAAAVLRSARLEAGLTLRALAALAGTSHATLSAYETGSKVPRTSTVDRIVGAAGFTLDRTLARRVTGDASLPRGEELVAVLELAAAFPARHHPTLDYPVFGR
jgi:transcriptional regulator with XRE-family HTH domain